MDINIVVVFDFDNTIIDIDSDNWVVDELGTTDLFYELFPTMPYNTLMDVMMKELHSRGKTMTDVSEVLSRVPIHPRVVPAIKAIHALGCDLKMVSDSNLFFIESILNNLGIKECFSEIVTNPSYIDNGSLRIFPYHDFFSCSHGCSRCPPNMCKGKIIEKLQTSLAKEGEKKKTIIYLGDGVGDFCPSLKMTETDFVMPRKNFPVWTLICENRELVKAEVHDWADGEELEQVLVNIIHLIGSDCLPTSRQRK